MSDEIDPVIAAAIDQFAAEQTPPLSREAAIALLLREALTASGYLPVEPEGEEGG